MSLLGIVPCNERRYPCARRFNEGSVTTVEGDEELAAVTEQVAFRLPKSLVENLDAYAQRSANEQAGMTFTQTDLVCIPLFGARTESAPKRNTKRGLGAAKCRRDSRSYAPGPPSDGWCSGR